MPGTILDMAHMDAAYETIAPYVCRMADPRESVDDKIRNMARFIIEYDSRTPALVNEYFCIAICCELDFETQRQMAWNLLTNMFNGNFKWLTLNNFSVEHALWTAGIIEEKPEKLRDNPTRVEFFDWSMHRKIVEKFKLPTCRVHPEKILTQEERNLRDRLNSMYPCRRDAQCCL
jgi:hypothetical protein